MEGGVGRGCIKEKEVIKKEDVGGAGRGRMWCLKEFFFPKNRFLRRRWLHILTRPKIKNHPQVSLFFSTIQNPPRPPSHDFLSQSLHHA